MIKLKFNTLVVSFIITIVMTACTYNAKETEKMDYIENKILNSQDYAMAVQYYNAQNYDDALIYYQKILNTITNESQMGSSIEYWIKGKLGRCYVLKKEYEKALPYITEAKEGLEKTGDNYKLSTIYREEGLYYAAIEQNDKALECYKKALEHSEGGELIQNYLAMAQSYLVLQEEQEALTYYDMAINEGEKQNDHASLVNVYYSKGVYLSQKNELEEAKLCMLKGLDCAEATWGSDDIKVAEGYRKLSKIYVRESDYEAAYVYCRKAMDIFTNQSEAYSYESDIVSLYSNMGYLNMALDDYAAALAMLKKSYAIVSERMEDNEFSEFYENVLSINIRSLYENLAVNDVEYELWFKENFEEQK